MSSDANNAELDRNPSNLSLEDLVADVLEAGPDERARLLRRIERDDASRARRVRSRLDALGEIGFSLDEPRRGSEPPKRFGPFERLERVGVGGMGEVYLARHVETGQLAALKLVRPEHQWFGIARERFKREIEASAQLAHDGIVRVLDVGEEHGVPWLAMGWVGGASLEHVLERLRGAPPETLSAASFEDALRAVSKERPHPEPPRDSAFPGASYVEVVTHIVARVAEALALAHAQGVLHRDVKPSNVLVTPSGRVVLVDFGLALPRGADRMTRTGAWLGSLPYAAPEQIDGSPRALDGRADVYSLAATLYELLTLRTPFLGGPENSVRQRISTGEIEPLRKLNPSVPSAIERVCVAALDVDRRRRPEGARELADDLQRALAGLPVRSRAIPAWSRVKRWARRHPTAATAASLAVLAVLGSIAFALRERALATRLTRLADAELVRGLAAEARDFWPAARERIPPMEAWLARADELRARRAEHETSLRELTERAQPYADSERARDQAATREQLATLLHELDGLAGFVARGDRNSPLRSPAPDEVRAREAANRELLSMPPSALVAALRQRVTSVRASMLANEVTWRPDLQQLDDFERLLDRAEPELLARSTFRFAHALDAWRHDALRRLIDDLEELEDLVPRVRAQLVRTRELDGIALGSGAREWERARTAIAASTRYGGLALEPLFGLVPLGEDTRSGMWEFLLVASGAAPARDERGFWRLDEGAGAVLVLLPGGRFEMGQRESEGVRSVSSVPVHEVELAPFLISKFELSVAQAERLGGFPPEKKRPADGRLPLALDWERARALLLRHGLELPTEAQWEYAARAGASGIVALEGYANVYDRAQVEAVRAAGVRPEDVSASFDDGFAGPAPIGSFAPNAFGLHDVLGNLSEWCLDHYVGRGYSSLVARPVDGLRATVVSAQVRVVRGGSYGQPPTLCQPPIRVGEAPGKMTYSTGVRPVLALRH